MIARTGLSSAMRMEIVQISTRRSSNSIEQRLGASVSFRESGNKKDEIIREDFYKRLCADQHEGLSSYYHEEIKFLEAHLREIQNTISKKKLKLDSLPKNPVVSQFEG